MAHASHRSAVTSLILGGAAFAALLTAAVTVQATRPEPELSAFADRAARLAAAEMPSEVAARFAAGTVKAPSAAN
jgi:hypothetical protein